MFGFITRGFKKFTHAIGGVVHTIDSVAHNHLFAEIGGAVAFTVPNLLSHVPFVGKAVKSIGDAATNLAMQPLHVTDAIVHGARIDRAAMGSLRDAIKDVKTIAPYAQTVIGFVPGVGTGIGAALGAGLALAEGQNITDALASAVAGALPGGAAAQAAFGVAKGVVQGHPIDTLAIDAIPGINDEQKKALHFTITAAKDLASGKSIDHALLDHAASLLPPTLMKAATIGAALGQAQEHQTGQHMQHAVDAADHLLQASQSKNPQDKADATAVVEHTKKLASQGHEEARRALLVLYRRAAGTKHLQNFYVHKTTGRVIDKRTNNPACTSSACVAARGRAA
jgi:hypothetical protein